ncbi:hypothetical protein SRB5_06550 [Streptomyces sp. RB5]|uniref:SalK n=1 Tax=Streptomyces smaragdinus TaxID=2585196 RepID=A0A7K0CAR9_9ACTN|nr:hypothetical protein [Streptomyces smaragdinus]MQY10547.1 hypothetical protein [Streptomyces smaragdinus]
MTDARAGRRCHHVLNPLNAVLYFSPEFTQAMRGIGLDTDDDAPGSFFGMRGYFAARSAAMGAVGPGTVTATFFNFSHELISRHIPHAWAIASPAQVLAARLAAADLMLRRLLGDEAVGSKEMAEAAELAVRAAEGAGRSGRPLYAAEADQPWAKAPHLALWQAATMLREHRGDGHIALLSHAGLDGIEALVSHTASGRGFTTRAAQTIRGHSAGDWAAAQERLRERGLLDADGELTPRGAELRKELEYETDRLAVGPYERLGAEGTERLTGLAGVFAGAAVGAFPQGLFGK